MDFFIYSFYCEIPFGMQCFCFCFHFPVFSSCQNMGPSRPIFRKCICTTFTYQVGYGFDRTCMHSDIWTFCTRTVISFFLPFLSSSSPFLPSPPSLCVLLPPQSCQPPLTPLWRCGTQPGELVPPPYALTLTMSGMIAGGRSTLFEMLCTNLKFGSGWLVQTSKQTSL